MKEAIEKIKSMKYIPEIDELVTTVLEFKFGHGTSWIYRGTYLETADLLEKSHPDISEFLRVADERYHYIKENEHNWYCKRCGNPIVEWEGERCRYCR